MKIIHFYNFYRKTGNLKQIFQLYGQFPTSLSTRSKTELQAQQSQDSETTQIQDKKLIKEDNIKKAEFNATVVARTSDSMPRAVFESRTAFIYKPCKNVMQSGSNNSNHWIVQFNSDVPRWENPVIGWSSSRDPVQALTFKFDSVEEAIRYVQSQGWAYEVKEDPEPVKNPKNYAENFTYSKGKLKIIKTK